MRDDGKPVGVVVVKVAFDGIEAQWRAQSGPTLVVDSRDMVMLTSQSGWRFRQMAMTGGSAILQDGDGHRYVAGEARVPLPGWTLRHLEPLDPFEATPATWVRELLFAAATLMIVGIGFAIRAHEKRVLHRDSRRQLEQEVEARTAELRESNAKLRVESNERQRADRRLRQAREELAQANRLGIIGQVTAGVAHEVNQPVAAIRTCAENAARLLARAETDRAGRNLDRIIDLTDRIGRITSELRRFARRGTPSIGIVSLSAAIDGALLLMGDRIRNTGVAIDRPDRIGDLVVVADSTRLEQILINLIHNALDALGGTSAPRIAIGVERGEATVLVTIADNGPGIAPDLADALFTPFVTGKADGLGLGLGIARDIAREFGGDIALGESSLGGAAFEITLRKANA